MKHCFNWINEFWKNLKWFEKKLQEKFSFTKIIKLNIHYFICVLTDGCSPEEYLWFEFYNKDRKERKTFLTYVRHARIQKKYNNEKVKKILSDKLAFNSFFSEEIGRDWIDADTASNEDLNAFVRKYKIVIVKPKKGGQGKGVYKYTISEGKKQFTDCLLEEYIIQHPALQEFNPHSVNTLRIGTICVNGHVEIFAAALRMAINEVCVDNIHSGGIVMNVDINNGIVNTSGINGELKRFDINPYSGKKLVGFQVPYWKETKELVKMATVKLSSCSIIGWDVAITLKGPILIEGNNDQGTDACQICDVKGKYNLINKIIEIAD